MYKHFNSVRAGVSQIKHLSFIVIWWPLITVQFRITFACEKSEFQIPWISDIRNEIQKVEIVPETPKYEYYLLDFIVQNPSVLLYFLFIASKFLKKEVYGDFLLTCCGICVVDYNGDYSFSQSLLPIANAIASIMLVFPLPLFPVIVVNLVSKTISVFWQPTNSLLSLFFICYDSMWLLTNHDLFFECLGLKKVLKHIFNAFTNYINLV